MARTGIILVAVALLLLVGISAVDAAYVGSGQQNDITAEAWSPNVGSYVELDDSNIADAYYAQNVTVRNEAGQRMEEGVDYEWSQTNGTIKALPGGGLDGTGQNASITYSYSIPSEFSTNMADTVGFALDASTALLIVLVAGFLLAGMRVLGEI